jgi:predicted hydrocarbon binding protein
VKYTAQNDQDKYVNFFNEKKTRIGFIKWSLNPGKVQIYDCSDAEELSWKKTPPTRSALTVHGLPFLLY